MILSFHDLYANAETVSISLDSLAPPNSDVSTLEEIRNLASLRNQSCCRECFISKPDDLECHIQQFEAYLALLNKFLARAKEERWLTDVSQAAFQWNSPFSISNTAKAPLFSFHDLRLEQTMALCFYAAALQEHACLLCAAMQSSEPSFDPATAATTAASLFRRAAGVYGHAKDVIALAASAAGEVPSLAPGELDTASLAALETAALGLAQGTAAERAEAKGASPAVVAAVHSGAISLFERAAAGAKAGGASERVRMWLALSSEFHAAQALRAQAAVHRQEGRLGVACAGLKSALSRVNRCKAVGGGDAEWRLLFSQEALRLQGLLAAYDKERTVVYMQGVSAAEPSLPEGKVVVAPAPLSLPPASSSAFL